MTDEPASRTPPRTLIISVYGLYGRDSGWLPVATLVRLMAAAGAPESAVRSSISRLKRRGLLVSRRVDGAAGYALSDDALAILADGDRRIFHRFSGGRGGDTDDWLLVVFSVPESDRARRHELRSELTRRGFGTVAPGVWIAPEAVADETADLLRRLGLDRYVQLFTGRPVQPDELPAKVAEWWNLPRIRRSYLSYLERWQPVLDRWRTRPGEPADAFSDYLHTLTDWRRLPYLDPGLPADVVPMGWESGQAADLFFALRDLLADPAREFVAPFLT